MKMLSMLAATGLLAVTAAGPVMAQAVTNSTAAGTATAPSAGEGAPAAGTSAGKVATSGSTHPMAKKYKRFTSSSRNTATGTAPAPAGK